MPGKRKCLLALYLLLILLSSPGHAKHVIPRALTISPDSFKIDAFFSGHEVRFSGSILSDRDVIIEIKGPKKKSKFKVKGKVGPLWMNREVVEIGNAPYFYALLEPREYHPGKEISKADLGIEHLKKNIDLQPEDLSSPELIDQFIAFKRSEKLYGEPQKTIRYSAISGGRKTFTVSIRFPASIIQGKYKISANIVHDNRVEKTLVGSLQIGETAVMGNIQTLAYKHPLAYGLMSVIIALLVGSVMGIIFQKRASSGQPARKS